VLKSGGDVIASLRRYATAALDTVRTAEGRPYDPNDEQDDESPYLEADRDELLDTALLDTILKAASLPQATDDDLRKRTLALYALVIGDDPDKLTAFVRRGNPVQLAKKGLVTVFDRTLTRELKDRCSRLTKSTTSSSFRVRCMSLIRRILKACLRKAKRFLLRPPNGPKA
jgi:hypothetical protein